jgi:ankyrin repeat protein
MVYQSVAEHGACPKNAEVFMRKQLAVSTVFVLWALWFHGVHASSDPARDFAERLTMSLAATENQDGDHAHFTLVLAATGTDELTSPYGRESFSCYVDGRREPSFEETSEYQLRKSKSPGYCYSSVFYRTEEQIRALLGVGRHEVCFQFGPVRSNVLEINVPEDAAIAYRPRYPRGSWGGERYDLRNKRLGGGPLHEAAWAGDEGRVRELLAGGADVNLPNDTDETPLHYATTRGFVRIAEALLAAHADPNARGPSGWSCLHEAAQDADHEIAELLIGAGADVNAKDEKGRRPLDVACRCSRREVARLLVKHGAAHDIFTASALGEVGLVKQLLAQDPALAKARYVPGEEDDAMALHFAAEWGQEEVARMLLAAGAPPDGGGAGRYSPEEEAADLRQYGVPFFREAYPPLHEAARRGYDGVVLLLLRSGAPINVHPRGQEAAFHAAARAGHETTVQLLLREGARPNVRDSDQRTPLHYAADSGNMAVANALLAGGANVDPADRLGDTPLFLAARRGLPDAVRLLVDKGADVNHRDAGGSTALHGACAAGHLEVVRFLLERGADTNAVDEHGRTPLNLAIRDGRREVADFLRQHGATK